MKQDTLINVLWAIVLLNALWLIGFGFFYLVYYVIESGWKAVLTMAQVFIVVSGITLIGKMESK